MKKNELKDAKFQNFKGKNAKFVFDGVVSKKVNRPLGWKLMDGPSDKNSTN